MGFLTSFLMHNAIFWTPWAPGRKKQHAIEDRDSAGGKCLLFQPNWLSPLLCKSDTKINWACKVLSLLFIHLLYLRKTVLLQCSSCLYLYTYIYYLFAYLFILHIFLLLTCFCFVLVFCSWSRQWARLTGMTRRRVSTSTTAWLQRQPTTPTLL